MVKFEISTATQGEDSVEWIKWYDDVKEVGGSFTIAPTRISFNEERMVFYLIDELKQVGTSVFAAHHPDSKFTESMPDGLRLASAFGRALEIKDEIEADSLVEAINEAAPWTVCVERTEKGRLWTATRHE